MDMLRTLGGLALASICAISVNAQTSIGDRHDLIEIEGSVVFMRQPALRLDGFAERIAQPCGFDAIAVDRWGNLYAVDGSSNTITIWSYYTLSGKPLETISSDTIEEAGLGPLKGVRAISTGSSDRLSLYLLDQSKGKYSVSRILMRPYLFSKQWVQLPFNDFRKTPHDFTIDVSGRLIVAESDGIVEVLLPDGSGHDAHFGNEGIVDLDDVDGLATSSLVAVDTDEQGNIYVADPDNVRIIKLDDNGNVTRVFGGRGGGRHQFRGPVAGVAVDWRGNVYGHDSSADGYAVFAPDGRLITRLGGHGFDPHYGPQTGDFVIDKVSRRFLIAEEDTQRISIHTMTRDHFLSRDFTRQEPAKRSTLQPVTVLIYP